MDESDLPLVSPYRWHVSDGLGRYPYARAYVKGVGCVPMHRFLLGAEKGQQVDHISGDTLDNRRANLRACDRASNLGNQRRRRATGFKGVYGDNGKWRAICAHTAIGSYRSEEAAARAYDRFARKRYGSFACVNFPEVGERSALTGEVRRV